MRWWWQARPGEPDTAESRVPEPYKPKVELTISTGFEDHFEWSRKSGGAVQHFRWATCLACKRNIGTCRGLVRMDELKQQHREKCWWPCGFLDCADCSNEPPTVVEYNAA